MPPEEVEALLPWHAAETLSSRDAHRIDETLTRDARLARQYTVIQEEFAETIHLNENLGTPSARAMQHLFADIDAEPVRKPSMTTTFSTRIAEFFGNLSPHTLAYSANTAALALLLQAGVIGAVLVRQDQNFETATFHAQANGTHALIRFTPEAHISDISQFLENYNTSIISDLKNSMFNVQFGNKALSKDETANLFKKIEAEKIVNLVAPTQ